MTEELLTLNQGCVLIVLKHYGATALTVREIADSCAMSVSSVRSALTALKRRGTVERCGYSAFTPHGATWRLKT